MRIEIFQGAGAAACAFAPAADSTKTKKPDRSALQARADATAEKKPDGVFERARHEQEIERAENIAAGLPPEATARCLRPGAASGTGRPRQEKAFASRTWKLPPEVEEEKYEPVPLEEPPTGIVGSIKSAANKVIRKVQRMIKPETKTHKELIINAESLEVRVALVEQGRLEELTIERTTEERLVGSIFKGKVRNLEDGLKAAFVDIGFEKNAFLHYWDIVPTSFDSGVEVVEREGKRRDRPRITQKDIPRLYPPGSEINVQVTKGPIGTKGPRVTTNIVLPGRYLVLLPNSDQSGVSRKIENPEERQRLKAHPA